MTKTDNVVWTDWLSNPGDGQCPVPEFHQGYYTLRWSEWMNGDAPGLTERREPGFCPESRNWYIDEDTDIHWYCYAIPEDLAWMAAYVETWPVGPDVCLSKSWFDGGEARGGQWARRQWLRARQDLGYAKESKDNTKHTHSINTEKRSVDQCRLDMLNSLYTAILKAGGDPRIIIDMDMTLESMITGLAQNGVRFCYDKQGKPEQGTDETKGFRGSRAMMDKVDHVVTIHRNR